VPALDWLHGHNPLLRKALWALPQAVQPRPKRTAWVVAVDMAGRIVADLQADGDRYHMVTGVREHDGKLYLGSIEEPAVGVVEVG
jgi:hypothetical protein